MIYDLPFLNEKAKRNILGGNAQRIFGMDVSSRFPEPARAAEVVGS